MISSEGTIANYWENNCHGDDKHFYLASSSSYFDLPVCEQ